MNLYFDATHPRKPQTNKISEHSALLKRVLDKNSAMGDTGTLGEVRQITFVIRGVREQIALHKDMPLLIGRFHINNHVNLDLDLAPYGAERRGVSRIHARLDMIDNNLYIMDMGSTNGTYIAGSPIEPHTSYMVHNNESVVLGNLPLQIIFE